MSETNCSESELSDLLCVDVADLTRIEVDIDKRRSRHIYNVWAFQGVDEDNLSQIYIAENEIDSWIEKLTLAKQKIKEHRDT